jgi:hypothetical protein
VSSVSAVSVVQGLTDTVTLGVAPPPPSPQVPAPPGGFSPPPANAEVGSACDDGCVGGIAGGVAGLMGLVGLAVWRDKKWMAVAKVLPLELAHRKRVDVSVTKKSDGRCPERDQVSSRCRRGVQAGGRRRTTSRRYGHPAGVKAAGRLRVGSGVSRGGCFSPPRPHYMKGVNRWTQLNREIATTPKSRSDRRLPPRLSRCARRDEGPVCRRHGVVYGRQHGHLRVSSTDLMVSRHRLVLAPVRAPQSV